MSNEEVDTSAQPVKRLVDVTGLDLPHPDDDSLYRPITHTEWDRNVALCAWARLDRVAREYRCAADKLNAKLQGLA